MWRRYAGSFGFIDHHGITVYCIGKIGTDGVFGDEVHVSPESPLEFVLEPHKLEEAFGAGKPDQDVDIARRIGFPPCIRAEDRDPVGTVPGEYCDDGLTTFLG